MKVGYSRLALAESDGVLFDFAACSILPQKIPQPRNISRTEFAILAKGLVGFRKAFRRWLNTPVFAEYC